MTELSKVYFQECNDIRKLTGEIKEDDGEFLILKTLKRKFTINKKFIVKIETELQEDKVRI